jgi:hypothetical protein
MTVRRQHNVIEGLREHRRREKANGAQGFRAGVEEIVRRILKNAAER